MRGRVRLVGAANRHVDVLGLLLREHRELRAKSREVEPSDLLVELLREEVDLVQLVLPAVALLPELELREGLVRERARPRLAQLTAAVGSLDFQFQLLQLELKTGHKPRTSLADDYRL